MSTRPNRPIRKGRSYPARSWGVSESLLHHAPAPGHLSPGGRILGRRVRPHTTACPVLPPVPKEEGKSRQIENKPDFHHLKQFLHACPLVVAVLKRNEAQRVPGRGVPATGTFLACAGCLIGWTGCEVSQCAARPAYAMYPVYWPGVSSSAPGLSCVPAVAPSSDCHMAVINLSHPQCDWPGAIYQRRAFYLLADKHHDEGRDRGQRS
jgi:hypothetical protein